jgi:hypothetical protein
MVVLGTPSYNIWFYRYLLYNILIQDRASCSGGTYPGSMGGRRGPVCDNDSGKICDVKCRTLNNPRASLHRNIYRRCHTYRLKRPYLDCTNQLRRDLHLWLTVPSKAEGALFAAKASCLRTL